jgi:hypothetical protein
MVTIRTGEFCQGDDITGTLCRRGLAVAEFRGR